MNELMGYIEMFWPFLVLVAVFYFFMYRPQKKQEQERNAFLGSLKKGDHVVTAGGIYGIIRPFTEIRPRWKSHRRWSLKLIRRLS